MVPGRRELNDKHKPKHLFWEQKSELCNWETEIVWYLMNETFEFRSKIKQEEKKTGAACEQNESSNSVGE